MTIFKGEIRKIYLFLRSQKQTALSKTVALLLIVPQPVM